MTRLTPIDDPPRAGLTNTGSPSRSRSSSSSVCLLRPQHHMVADRQAVGDQQLLGELLVHARRAGQHARPDVRHAGQFEQPLDGAVLAVGPVQHREDHVDGGQQLAGRALPERQQLTAATGVGRQRQRGTRRSADLRQPPVGDRQGVRVGVGQHPRALRRDADRDHLEALRIEVAQDATCGNA